MVARVISKGALSELHDNSSMFTQSRMLLDLVCLVCSSRDRGVPSLLALGLVRLCVVALSARCVVVFDLSVDDT